MHARRSILALSILVVFVATGNADKKAAPRQLTTKDCERLVAQLVNPEAAPFKGDYKLQPPDQKHTKTFKKIGEAYNTLSKNIEVSLPVLMKYRNDTRYSFIQEQPGSGAYSKITVGTACSDIVQAHIEAHLENTFCHDGEGRPRGYYFIFRSGGLDKWWESRKEKKLNELQLEAMEWVMKQKKPKAFKSEKAWRKALEGVKKQADGIRKTRKPVVVDHRFYYESS